MTVNPRLQLVALDAADIAGLAEFYLKLTGWAAKSREDDWIVIEAPDGQQVAFQLAPDHVPPQWPGQEHPQQVHLDLGTADIEAAARRAAELGARRLGGRPEGEGVRWITMADPAGHPFDLTEKKDAGQTMTLVTVTIDAPDAPALAAFYRDLLGWTTGYEGPEGVHLSDGLRGLWIQPVEGYRPPSWPDPAHPQQGHLDILVDDLPAGRDVALGLGAKELDTGPQDWWVFADPAGHPFCLCRASET